MSAFEQCHKITARWEKGYANHPRDPGGATMNGVTQRVYDAWRQRIGRPRQAVRLIGPNEELEIYRQQYWEAVSGEKLPPGIDLVVYDMAVNSGPQRAIKYLQASLGLKQDGQIGQVTLAALREVYERDADDDVIDLYMAARNRFLRSLRTFDVFGKGWMNRTRDVEAKAERMEAIEDEARTYASLAKNSRPVLDKKDAPPVIYAPDKAVAPAEPAVRADKAAKTGGALGGLVAIGSAVQAAIGGVKETLDGILPSGGAVVLAVVVTVAIVAGLYAWQQWKEADVKPHGEAQA